MYPHMSHVTLQQDVGSSPSPAPNSRRQDACGVQQVVVSEVDSFSARLNSILSLDVMQVQVLVWVCVWVGVGVGVGLGGCVGGWVRVKIMKPLVPDLAKTY